MIAGKKYWRDCAHCGAWLSTPWLSRCWAFDRDHRHEEEKA